ncbi:hypothetical protein Microterr_27130 [Microbacterium terricola]|uniref:Uncharacterized protein n=1 Tax=Microbacterium terricola TaxID=344163 RepID=A0ABM8E271_9MICO|nr:hypothetical protein Microterr_27130 [Microbacterium terricola]
MRVSATRHGVIGTYVVDIFDASIASVAGGASSGPKPPSAPLLGESGGDSPIAAADVVAIAPRMRVVTTAAIIDVRRRVLIAAPCMLKRAHALLACAAR